MASLSWTGTVAVSIDMLIILVKTGNRMSMQSFIIDAGRGSKLQVLRREELTKLFTWSSVMRSNSESLAMQAWASPRELATGVYLANKSFLIASIFWQKNSANLFASTSEDGAEEGNAHFANEGHLRFVSVAFGFHCGRWKARYVRELFTFS